MGKTESFGPSANGLGDQGNGRLEELVAQYIGRLNDGERLDRDRILHDHPDMGHEILKYIEVFAQMGGPGDTAPTLGILGDYKLLRQIGRGGMGVVYEAWENSMDRRVALKVLPRDVAGDTKAVTRFIREAQVAGKLNHSNVVSVYSMGVTENVPYYAMEYVKGETLAQVLRRLHGLKEMPAQDRKSTLLAVSRLFGERHAGEKEVPVNGSQFMAGDARLNLDEISFGYCVKMATAFAEVAEGLQVAHQNGIIHRDIKPSNLILDEEGRLRILDFGLARLEGQESLTRSSVFVGTPLYMSPEQARARKIAIDHRTDIYSLGATLYEMLTYRPPFKGKDNRDTLSQILTRDPRPPRKLNARIPRDLETIVLKCLRKEPPDRYGTAEALAQDLRRFVRADPIEARPEPGWKRSLRRGLRNRWRVAAVGAAVLLVLTTALLFHKHWRDAANERNRAAAAALAEREALYEDLVVGGVTKMALGRPARKRGRRGDPDQVQQVFVKPDSLENTSLAGMLAPEETWPDPVEEAVVDLEEAARLIPYKPEAYYHLARAYRLLERAQEAEYALNKALECDPDFAPAVILEKGLEAAASLEMRSQLDESEGGSWTGAWIRAFNSEQAKDWTEAEKAYGELLRFERSGSFSYLGFSQSILMGRGHMRLEAQDLDGAIVDFAVACDRWPELVEPGLLLGKIFCLKGNPDQAEQIFMELLERARVVDEVALGVGRIYDELGEYTKGLSWVVRAGECASREGMRASFLRHLDRLEEAVAAYRKAIQLDPHSAEMHMNLGIALAEQNNYLQAENALREAARLAPESAHAYYNLGLTLHYQGKFEETVEMYEKSIALDSSNAGAHHNLGAVLKEQGDLDGAMEKYKKAIDLIPESAIPCNSLGAALADQRKYVEAIKYCEKAIARDPDHPFAYINLGISFAGLERYDEAIEKYNKAIELDGKIPEAHFNLGVAFWYQARYEKAIDAYEEAIRLDEDYVFAWNNLGLAFSAIREYEEAINAAETAIELDPEYVDAYLAHGLYYEEQGNPEKALPIYQQAARIDSNHAFAHFKVGSTFAALGDLDNAVAALRIAIALDPQLSWPYGPLAMILRAGGDPAAAEACLIDAFESGITEIIELWDLWFLISAMDLKQSPSDILASMPEGADRDANSYPAGLSWALVQLSINNAVRLNCGGDDYWNPDGILWGKDRFVQSGRQSPEHEQLIAAVEDDALYLRSTVFSSDQSPPYGYRIPLPPDRYRITLRFAEVEFQVPGKRKFDVLLEGETVLEDYEPKIDRAEIFSFERAVDDGFLNIEFVHKLDDPMISAIEIVRSTSADTIRLPNE